MRKLLLASALISALAIPAAARADTFSFTPTGGSAVTFTLPAGYLIPAPPFYSNFILVPMMDSGQIAPFGNVQFYNPTAEVGVGAGPLDFFIYDPISSLDTYYFGDKLYSGSEGAPSFIPGTYLLGATTDGGGTGTLIIDGGAAPTPEPSSLLLLGTGFLGLVGIARRRFV